MAPFSVARALARPNARPPRGLQVVARIGVGFDAIDVPALTKRKVPLMTVGIANSPSVAEQAMHMMMSLAKRGFELNTLVASNNWAKRMSAVPFDLFEKTVLIVGFGRIGTRTAKRCAAMEMNVLIYDPYVPAATIKAAGYEAVSDLDAALAAGGFRFDPLSESAGDDRHVQCRAPRPDEADGLSRQHRARRHRRREGAACGADHGQARRRRSRRLRQGAARTRQSPAEIAERHFGAAYGRRHARSRSTACRSRRSRTA